MAETGPRRLWQSWVRVYETLQDCAHLERDTNFVPASIVYLRRNYDFDDSPLAGLDVHHCGSLRALAALVVRWHVWEMEVNEPLMLSALKLSLTAALASRLGGLLRGRRTRVVTYALANSDPFADATRRLRSRHRRIAFRLGYPGAGAAPGPDRLRLLLGRAAVRRPGAPAGCRPRGPAHPCTADHLPHLRGPGVTRPPPRPGRTRCCSSAPSTTARGWPSCSTPGPTWRPAGRTSR